MATLSLLQHAHLSRKTTAFRITEYQWEEARAGEIEMT
jgi:hypothetical protein